MERSIFVAECVSFEDILALPSVAYEERRLLPHAPGIYFLVIRVFEPKIIYIGSSKNLCTRWSKHHRQSEVELLRLVDVSTYIHYVVFPSFTNADLFPRESILRQRFSPPFNAVTPLDDIRSLTRAEIERLAGAIAHPLESYTQQELVGLLRLTSFKVVGTEPKGELCQMIRDLLGDLCQEKDLPLKPKISRMSRYARQVPNFDEKKYSQPRFVAIAQSVRPQLGELESKTIRDLQKIGRQLEVYRCNHLSKNELIAKIRSTISLVENA